LVVGVPRIPGATDHTDESECEEKFHDEGVFDLDIWKNHAKSVGRFEIFDRYGDSEQSIARHSTQELGNRIDNRCLKEIKSFSEFM
jgi:hypothetical protein